MSRKTFQRICGIITLINAILYFWFAQIDPFELPILARVSGLLIMVVLAIYCCDKAAQHEHVDTIDEPEEEAVDERH